MQQTFSAQHRLPRLPIPSLEHTCSVYLKSLIPLQTKEEHEKTRAIVEDFLKSELSKSLQQRLIDIDRVSPFNWLEDNFWLRKAYLEWREPLIVNSNWYVLGKNDENHPQHLLSNQGIQPSGYFSKFQVKRAAHLIRRILEYKEKIDREEIPVNTAKDKEPLCMYQYSRIFSMTRIPFYQCDMLFQGNPKEIRHIVVLLRDQVYQLNVYKEIKKDIHVVMTSDEIENALLTLVSHVQHLKQPSASIPLLTSWQRDNWAIARNHLLTIDPIHRDHLNTIESALFAVALDDHSSGTDAAPRTHSMLCGHLGLGNGHNRWFDKSITLVVENNGLCAFAGEHSPADVLIISYIIDYMLDQPVPLGNTHTHTHELITSFSPMIQEPPGYSFQHLAFNTNTLLDWYIAQAQKTADEIAALSDSDVLIFNDYGTDWIKKTARVSPDAYLQMVLQLAYYRVHGRVTPTYETGSTRKYLHGRTETIRTVSTDSKAFVEAFDDPLVAPQKKYELLKSASATHQHYTRMASDGYGCDRHLLALRVLSQDHQLLLDGTTPSLHPLFTDPIYTESQTWRLSTSGLQAGVQLMGTGFGVVAKDGYGINYMPAPTLVKFSVESKRVSETVSTLEFLNVIDCVMKDLYLFISFHKL